MAKNKIDLSEMDVESLRKLYSNIDAELATRRNKDEADRKKQRESWIEPYREKLDAIAALYKKLNAYKEKARLEVNLGGIQVVDVELYVAFSTNYDLLIDINADWASDPLNESQFLLVPPTKASAFANRFVDVLGDEGTGIPAQWIKKLSPEMHKMVKDLAALYKKLASQAEKAGDDPDEIIDAYSTSKFPRL